MCGFAGYYEKNGENNFEQILPKMGHAIQHRGPDAYGQWFDKGTGLGFCHQRLAIVELSEAGAQPMSSNSSRYEMVFNGEVYNHNDLRSELESEIGEVNWSGLSDTETLLACIDVWGIKNTLTKSIGMFALALWDKEQETLTLARDRLGEKPLYYGWHGDTFLFGSELKALTANPNFIKEINRDSITLLLRHNYIPSPHCIWKRTAKLEPATILTVSLADKKSTQEEYWSLEKAVLEGVSQRESVDNNKLVDELEETLKLAISKQMMADVPLGAFLSGGVDSSVIVALMQSMSKKPVKTFSIGFNEKQFNEAEHAKAVAAHLGTDHTEKYVTAEDALGVVNHLSKIYDEPFADSSAIPTYLVSEIAKAKVTVTLSGDAGDELFCGYNRYMMTDSMWSKIKNVPMPLRKVLGKSLQALSPQAWDKIGCLVRAVSKKNMPAYFGDKIHKGAGVLDSRDASDLYLKLVSLWQLPESVVLNSNEPSTPVSDINKQINVSSDVERMMATDMQTYLMDDILTKVDRAAMAVSLETRVPFLDHQVVEKAWKIPLEYKIKDNQSKWILRQVLYRHVPKHLIERPKMGFAVPLDSWLRGPLKSWAYNLISPERLSTEGYFSASQVIKLWDEHQSGVRNWSNHLWGVLMFQLWLDEQDGVRLNAD